MKWHARAPWHYLFSGTPPTALATPPRQPSVVKSSSTTLTLSSPPASPRLLKTVNCMDSALWWCTLAPPLSAATTTATLVTLKWVMLSLWLTVWTKPVPMVPKIQRHLIWRSRQTWRWTSSKINGVCSMIHGCLMPRMPPSAAWHGAFRRTPPMCWCTGSCHWIPMMPSRQWTPHSARSCVMPSTRTTHSIWR